MKNTEINIGYPINTANPTGEPLPTQDRFHRSGSKYRLLAGGFATGKTTSLCLEILKEVFKYPKNYGVLGRKDLQELKSTTLKELLDICPPVLIADHNKQDRVIRFANHSEIYYMNLDDSREATEKIKSLNLGFVAIDQLEEIQEPVFYAFQGRLRRQESSRNFFATCNPAGHDWIWRRWKDAQLEGHELFEAITLENTYLPADYVQELLNYPDKWVKRYVYCSWEDFEGLVYNEFVESLHVLPAYEPSDGDSHIHVLDYGFRNPTCILFAATDYEGVTTIYDEYYESGRLIKDTSDYYKGCKYIDRAYRIADPSINKTERDGLNVKKEFLDNGIHWFEADNDVRQGIDRVNTLFKEGKIRITKNCVNTLREIGAYKWKELKPGQERAEYEEPVKRDDHAMDCIRYLANYIYTPKREEKEIYARPYIFEQQIAYKGAVRF